MRASLRCSFLPLPTLDSVPELYEHALKYEPSTHIVASGALATLSGAKTGRSPKCAVLCEAVSLGSWLRCAGLRARGAGQHAGPAAGPPPRACCSAPALPTLQPCAPNLPRSLLSPLRRDKRVVREPGSEADIWWGAGSPNYEMDER